jgi:hypothetical protein
MAYFRHAGYRLDSAFNHGDHPSAAAEGFCHAF